VSGSFGCFAFTGLAKCAGELTALSVSLSCLLLNGESFALLRPNTMFLPQVEGRCAKGFPSPHASEAELHLLCPVQALAMQRPGPRSICLCVIATLSGATLSLSSGCLAGCVRLFAFTPSRRWLPLWGLEPILPGV